MTSLTKWEKENIQREINKKGIDGVIERLNNHYIKTSSYSVKEIIEKQLNYIETKKFKC